MGWSQFELGTHRVRSEGTEDPHLFFEQVEQEVEAVLGPELGARALRAVGHAAQQAYCQRPQLRARAIPDRRSRLPPTSTPSSHALLTFFHQPQ